MWKAQITSKNSIKAGVLAGALLIAPIALAAPPSASVVDESVREQQRELFKQAEIAVKRRRIKEYQQLVQQLEGYPLLPYLELDRIGQIGYIANEDYVLSFFDRYQQSPLDWQARQPWLDYLMRQGDYQRFVRDFKAPGSQTHQCFLIEAQLALLPTEQHTADQADVNRLQVLRQVDTVWRNGSSLPKACDTILAAWAEAGLRTPELIWERVVLAAEGGQHTLLPYLGRLLPEPMQYLAEHYRRVRVNPSYVTRFSALTQAYPEHEAQILSYGLRRLIWRDPDLALATLAKLPSHIVWTAEQQLSLNQTFATALSVKNHPQAETWLARLAPNEHNDTTRQWQLADWVRRGAWQQIIEFMPRLPDTERESDQWQYWFARSLESLGQPGVSAPLWRELAQSRSYYGFLAAAKLDVPLNLQRQPLQLSEQQRQALWQLDGVQRAYELRALDRHLDARREWFYMVNMVTPAQQLQLAALASEWGWHDQAIYTLGQAGEFDAVAQRFPEAYLEQHQKFADAAQIDVNWALAVSRRESAFRHDARSHAGAYGLMQLLPSTARLMEDKPLNHRDLFHVETNIRLGTRYLSHLQQRLEGNWLLATAAYNAGIYRVYDWIPAQPLAADRWIETIPYAETRNYVKNVLAYQQIYRALRQGEQQPELFQQVVPMRIGKLPATSANSGD